MHKHRIIALLARKMAGEAKPLELLELEELMVSFPDSIYYDELLKQFWLLNHKAELPDPELAFERHIARFEKDFEIDEPIPNSPKKSRLKPYLFAAICTLAISSVALFFFTQFNKSTSLIQIVSAKGLRKKIALPDGTIVWLNADSRLTYDANIKTNQNRIVSLEGEAFFQVAHQRSQPFIVKTKKMSVKVLGTSFNLKAYNDEEKAEATLIKGSIELSVNDRPEQKILLNPSEKFALVKHGKINDITLMIQRVTPVKIGDKEYLKETSWKESQLIFKNETFDELKPKLERWFNVKIEFQSPHPKSYKFTGIFEQETIREALTALQLIKPFNFKIKAYDVIIY